jgi:hypothetical protein
MKMKKKMEIVCKVKMKKKMTKTETMKVQWKRNADTVANRRNLLQVTMSLIQISKSKVFFSVYFFFWSQPGIYATIKDQLSTKRESGSIKKILKHFCRSQNIFSPKDIFILRSLLQQFLSNILLFYYTWKLVLSLFDDFNPTILIRYPKSQRNCH